MFVITKNKGQIKSISKQDSGDRISPEEQAILDKLDAMAAAYEKELAKSLMDTFDHLDDQVDESALIKALEIGGVSVRATDMTMSIVANAMAPAIEILHNAYVESAIAEANFITETAIPPAPPPVSPPSVFGSSSPPSPFKPQKIVFQFDKLNPRIVDFMKNYEMNLIREINDSTREGIQSVIDSGIKSGANPRDIARDVRKLIGLTKKQSFAVQNFRTELQNFHKKKTAAGWNLGGQISRAPGGAQTYETDANGNVLDGIMQRRLRDFRYDKTLQKTMATGNPLSPQQIDKMVEAYRRKYLKHRSENIARTESLRAVNAGVLASWNQAVGSGVINASLVRKKWLIGSGERTCPICRPLPMLNKGAEGYGIPLDEKFNIGGGVFVMLSPLHPSCRCGTLIRAIEPEQVK